MKIRAIALLTILLLSAERSVGAQIPPFKVVNGQCSAKSHIARGPVGADLTKLQTPYSCDSVVISETQSTGSAMFQFADRHSAKPVGFAGHFDTPYLMKVERVYLAPGQAVAPNDGYCRLWDGDRHPGTISHFTIVLCAAQIDEGNTRIVPFMLFDAK